jgi:hypothetical protein
MKSELENDISLTLLKILAASLGNAAEPKCRDQSHAFSLDARGKGV